MSAKLKYLMPLLSIFAVAACEEEQSGTSVENTVLDVISAVYDDAAGAYSVELGKDGTTVSFVLSSQREGLIYSSPVPATGTYRTDATEEDRVLEAGASWTSEDGMEFVADEAWVSAVSDGTGCRLNGTFSDAEGNSITFSCGNVAFTHTMDSPITADSAFGEVSEAGSYTLFVRKGDNYLRATLSIDQDAASLEPGVYEMTDASVVMGDTGYSIDGVVSVARASGAYMLGIYGIYGAEGSEVGIRATYTGPLPSPDMMHPDLYTLLAGDWTVTSERQCVYDRDTKTWVITDEPYTVTCSAAGIPDYRYMMMTGFMESFFSFFIGVDVGTDNTMFIPSSHETNPVALVSAGSSRYLLFLTLYDPATGYFRTSSASNSVPVVLSDDYSTMSVQPMTSVSSEGEEINYNYLALFGVNTTSGSYTRFTNWPCIYIPQFTRPDAAGSAAAPAPLRVKGGNVKAVEVVPSESITEIIPIER